jgi:CDP-diacylglycerol--serine O-phosphatidyltransferase
MCPQFTILHGKEIWSIAALFACCAALRLARFNVESDSDDEHITFAGLPTPAAAAAIASFAILSYSLRNEVAVVTHENFDIYDLWMQRLLPMFTVLIAILMVSRIPYPHPLGQFVRGQASFAHLVGIVFAVLALLIVRGYAVPLLCVLFVLVPPIRYAWELVRHRRTTKEPLF